MATVSETSLKIYDVTTCSICLETFKEPKVLPCIHTFCLQCLDSYCSNKKQDEMSCPLCRKVFTIPTAGVQQLPNNLFMHQLLQLNKSTGTIGAPVNDKPPTCELCSDSDVTVPSTSYCIECDQHICDHCLGSHKKFKLFKSHLVLHGNDVSNAKMRLTLKMSYCNQHPDDQNILYCYDCKTIMCHRCLGKHSQHKCSDVSESAEKFREQLKDDVEKVSACAFEKQLQIDQLETDKNSFIKKVASTESEISQKFDQIISLIQSQKSQLMEELSKFKDKIVKKMENIKNEIERQFVIRESFKRYCQEMMNKGTACDISRAAHDLHARAEELVKTQDEPDGHKLSGVKITFKPSLSAIDSVKNFIGELIFRGGAVSTIKAERSDQNMCLTKFLDKPTLRHVILDYGDPISGITVLGGEIFVVRLGSQVTVYKSDDFTLTCFVTITGSDHLRGLVSCAHYNCLYVSNSDCAPAIIYRRDLTSNITTNWSVGGECLRLSVTKCNHILATLSNINLIKEYTTHGGLIREISLDKSINYPRHCVQLSTDNFAVCHKGTKQPGVCIVDQSGRITQSCGGSQRSGGEELYDLIIDTRDHILVADGDNNRVQLFSPTLTYLGDVVIDGYQLNDPHTLYLDTSKKRLFIGEWQGGRIFVLDVDIK